MEVLIRSYPSNVNLNLKELTPFKCLHSRCSNLILPSSWFSQIINVHVNTATVDRNICKKKFIQANKIIFPLLLA